MKENENNSISIRSSMIDIPKHIRYFFVLKPIDSANFRSDKVNCIILTVIIVILNFTAFICAQMITINFIGAFIKITLGSAKRLLGMAIFAGFYGLVSLLYSIFYDNLNYLYSYYYIGILSTIHLPLLSFAINVPRHFKWMKTFHHILLAVESLISETLTRRSILGGRDVDKKKKMITIVSSIVGFQLFYYFFVYYFLLV